MTEPPKGLVHIYTGDGKGKTTAALGLAVRAAGHGMKTFIAQFMKGLPYGELISLAKIPQITLMQYGGDCCIRKEEVTQSHIDQAKEGLRQAQAAMMSGDYDIVVLDEINVAVWFGLLSIAEVLPLFALRPAHLELILTGRRAPREFLDQADLITEVTNIRHYYDKGIQARKGIEY